MLQAFHQRPRRAQAPVGIVFAHGISGGTLLRDFATAVGTLQQVLLGAAEGGGGEFVVDKRGDGFEIEVVDGIKGGHGAVTSRE